MVISSRLIAKIAINGETVYVEELYIEMKTEGTEENRADAGSNEEDDSDDEIPF